MQSSGLVSIAYLAGVLACVFHLANGIWTMGITWGVWTTPAGQRRATYIAAAIGAVLTVSASRRGADLLSKPRTRSSTTARWRIACSSSD